MSRNVYSDESGILRIRRGSIAVNQSIGDDRFLCATEAFGGMVAFWRGSLFKFFTDGTYQIIGENIFFDESQTENRSLQMIRWSSNGNEVLYLFSGRGIYETFGEGVSLVEPHVPESGESPNLLLGADGKQDVTSGPARCRFAVLRASLSQRLVAAGDPESPNTVYMSAPLDASYWPVDQIIQLPDDGGYITGLAIWYGALIIFRNKDIWAFFGADLDDASASLVLQDSSVGCVAHKSIAAVPNIGLVFLGPDNIYALQQVVAIENQAKAVPIGDDIRNPLIESFKDQIVKDGICAIYHNQQYRLSIPNTRKNESVFRLSIQNGIAWYMDTGPRVADYFLYNERLFGVDYKTGEILCLDGNWLFDKQAKIPFFVAFRREDLQPGPSRIKRLFIYTLAKGEMDKRESRLFSGKYGRSLFGRMYVKQSEVILGTEQHLDVSLVVDGHPVDVKRFGVLVERESSMLNLGTEPVRVYEYRFRPSLKGSFAQVRISSTQAGEDIAILGYAIDYMPNNVMKGKRVR